jgi:tripartite-type tricarboxylate transporter receptor subunit TctC
MARFASRLLIVAAAALAASGARAEYPDKTITFVVPFAAASATDQLARALAIETGKLAKVSVIVDDKPGASGFIGAGGQERRRTATVFITTTTHAANEHLWQEAAVRSGEGLRAGHRTRQGGRSWSSILIRRQVRRRFIKLAAQPGKTFSAAAVVVANRRRVVPANGRHRAVTCRKDKPAGHQRPAGRDPMMITDMATGLPQVKGGKLRASASARRSARRWHPTSRRSTRPA